jgi:sugar phosphate isomerase/epimerase
VGISPSLFGIQENRDAPGSVFEHQSQTTLIHAPSRKPISPLAGTGSVMFGISTFCLHSLPLSLALERIAEETQIIEVMDDGPHHIERPDPLESYDVSFTLHSPSRGVNIASLLEPIRRASVEVLDQCFAVAAEVNAPVVVHPGYFAWAEERTGALRQFLRSIDDLSAAARERSVTYYVENMGNWDYFFLRTPDELPLIGECGFALDVGHANLNHCLDGFLEWPISHVHLHDNTGKEDTHLAVGKGEIDFVPVMEAVRRNKATPIVEVATLEGVMESIRVLEGM